VESADSGTIRKIQIVHAGTLGKGAAERSEKPAACMLPSTAMTISTPKMMSRAASGDRNLRMNAAGSVTAPRLP
jgi:hypothetical protein